MIQKTEECELGVSIRTGLFWIFFGKKEAQIPKLTAKFPQLSFMKVNQVHGAHLIQILDSDSCDGIATQQADALWTERQNTALCIATADCMPIMICDHSVGRIAAIHAGWRSLAANITESVVNTFLHHGSHLDHLHFFIGPHIGPASFAVDKDVKDIFLKDIVAGHEETSQSSEEKSICTYNASENKYYLNLQAITRSRLKKTFNIKTQQIDSWTPDTRLDSRFHSYRRDRENAGRQLSFITLLG